jgi:phosphoribosylglycinamide formyltransferase 1
MSDTVSNLLPIAVFVSGQGRGSNLGALLDGCASGQIAGHIAVVIATRADAPALERAKAAGVTTSVVSPRKYENDEAGYAAVLLKILQRHQIQLICLAGYTRMLPLPVVDAFRNRIMNIHPALLPFFGGHGMYLEHVHQAVLESGMKVSGCTVHFVDEQYDTGPIILQTPVPVEDEDTPATLAARILPEEHRTYVRAVELFAAGRLRVDGRRVFCTRRGEEISQ